VDLGFYRPERGGRPPPGGEGVSRPPTKGQTEVRKRFGIWGRTLGRPPKEESQKKKKVRTG